MGTQSHIVTMTLPPLLVMTTGLLWSHSYSWSYQGRSRSIGVDIMETGIFLEYQQTTNVYFRPYTRQIFSRKLNKNIVTEIPLSSHVKLFIHCPWCIPADAMCEFLHIFVDD